MNAPDPDIQVSIAPFSPALFAELQDVRSTVFTQEQGVDVDINFDGLDPEAVHAVAQVDGLTVGTARMLPDGHIGRVAVLKDHRHCGIGTALTRALVDHARTLDYGRVYLASQTGAIPFYRKLGFSVLGDTYIEADIPHRDMQLVLS